jgi:hypothetical protein
MQGLAKKSTDIMFTSFLFERLSHLNQFYKTEEEFVQHLMSGDVKISIPDLIKMQSEYEQQKPPLPSRWQHGDQVLLCLLLKPDETFNYEAAIPATIHAAHFYTGKVKYDLDITLSENFGTRVYNIDSVFVEDISRSSKHI